MLETDNVSKSYDGKVVLHPVSLSLEAGRTYVLIGPSGCGKSTLLRLLIGLIPPSSGTIRFQGKELSADNLLELRRGVGYVIQDGGLFPHLTAESNVKLMADFLEWDEQRKRNRIKELAELTRFPQGVLARFPAELSGGQQQRVSLMRALMLDPDLLLLDEPLGALDPMVRSELQRDLKAIFLTLGKTVVLVTHDIGEAAFFANTILLMREGHLVQRGSFRDLVTEPADPFVTEFIQAQRSVLAGADLP